MNKELLSEKGFYHERGGIVWAIGKLMEINDLLFDAMNGTGPASGVRLDYQPVFAEISKLVAQLRIAMDGEEDGN